MAEQRFEFVVEYLPHGYQGWRYMATLGDYDLDCPTGTGDSPQTAIIDWLELHGETLI